MPAFTSRPSSAWTAWLVAMAAARAAARAGSLITAPGWPRGTSVPSAR